MRLSSAVNAFAADPLKGINMRLFSIHCFLALSIFTQVTLADADPFIVRNYQQGMTLEQVGLLAKKQGHILLLDDIGKGSITIQQGRTDIAYLSFCNDRLYYASYLVHGGFETFIKLLDSLTMQNLQKTDVSWQSYTGYDGKERSNMTVSFFPPGSKNEYYVTADLYACEGYGIISSQLTWRAVSGYCK